MPNPDNVLLPGMYVRVKLEQGVDDKALLVPQQALQRTPDGAQSLMLVNKENKVEQVPVTTGGAVKTNWIVTSGLKAGDTVVVEGFQKIRPGAPVQASPWKAGGQPGAAPAGQPAAQQPAKPAEGAPAKQNLPSKTRPQARSPKRLAAPIRRRVPFSEHRFQSPPTCRNSLLKDQFSPGSSPCSSCLRVCWQSQHAGVAVPERGTARHHHHGHLSGRVRQGGGSVGDLHHRGQAQAAPGPAVLRIGQRFYGTSTITATFAPGRDPDLAQVDVQNRVSNVIAQLPTAVQQQGLKYEQTSTGFLLVVTVSSTDGSLDQTALADYIARNIQNPISRVPGVGQFQLFAAPRAMRIWVDPAKLVGFNLSMAEVNQAISAQNVLISGGSVGSPPNPDSQRITATVTANGQLSTIEGFGKIVLRANTDGSKVLLRDVARIEVGADNYQFGARLNGKPTAAFAVVLSPNANALATAQGVRKQMDELAKYFPGNITYSIPYDTAPYVKVSIEQVLHTLVEAMVLVFLVMYLFLQNVRYTLIPALVVPVAMLGTFAVMLGLGFSINVLTMFAMVLAIGILVDDAIVVVENVERIMATEGLPPKEATKKPCPRSAAPSSASRWCW